MNSKTGTYDYTVLREVWVWAFSSSSNLHAHVQGGFLEHLLLRPLQYADPVNLPNRVPNLQPRPLSPSRHLFDIVVPFRVSPKHDTASPSTFICTPPRRDRPSVNVVDDTKRPDKFNGYEPSIWLCLSRYYYANASLGSIEPLVSPDRRNECSREGATHMSTRSKRSR